MRNLSKGNEPTVLASHAVQWLEEYELNPTSPTCRFRYRHPNIKAALRAETGGKCIYCESQIGHNTPGDVEHKVPSSADRTRHFMWANLTLACTECNRRKGNYNNSTLPFLDPYVDDVEAMLVHHGPIVGWHAGDLRTESTIRRLELNSANRTALIVRKIEQIEELNNLMARIAAGAPPVLLEALKKRLAEMQDLTAEYSAMSIAICRSAAAPDEDQNAA